MMSRVISIDVCRSLMADASSSLSGIAMIRKKGFPAFQNNRPDRDVPSVARGLQPFGKLAAIRHAGEQGAGLRNDGNTELGEVFQAGFATTVIADMNEAVHVLMRERQSLLVGDQDMGSRGDLLALQILPMVSNGCRHRLLRRRPRRPWQAWCR